MLSKGGRALPIIFTFIIILIFMVGCSSERAFRKSWQPFAAVEQLERTVSIQTNAFPDSVVMVFPWLGTLQKNEASLWEEIGGDMDSIPDFSARCFSLRNDASVVFLEDCSASMSEWTKEIDSAIVHLSQDMPTAKAGWIRFAKNVVVMGGGMWEPQRFQRIATNFNTFPDPGGTHLAKALQQALSLFDAAEDTSQRVIVLLTDSSIGRHEITTELLQTIEQQGVHIAVFTVGSAEQRVLADLGNASGGFYLPSIGLSLENEMSTFLRGSCTLTYAPLHRSEDGRTHRVILSIVSPPIQRYGDYTAPGRLAHPIASKYSHRTAEKPFELPKELLTIFRVPFVKPGNDRVIASSRYLLDSLTALIAGLPDTMRLELTVRGYTCDLGSDNLNRALSIRRAEAVAGYLVEKLGSRIIITAEGFGEANPILPNTDEKNRRVNRRVEITVRFPKKYKDAAQL